MAGLCHVPATGNAFLSGILQHLDCQAQTIGMSGYQALASPSSNASLILTALLTIFIALYGVRMLMGQTPEFGELLMATFKIGVVLALATSWAAYRVVAYDAVLNGPAEIVESIGAPTGLPGSDGGLVQRLQWVDDAIVSLTVVGAGRFDPVLASEPGATPANAANRTPMTDDFALGFGRVAYLAGTIGSFALVRIIAGVLLALAPLFAGFLLFEGTRGFFMGWLKLLVGSALGAVMVTMLLTVELSLLEPWLADVLSLRAQRYSTPAAPIELFVMTLAFAVVLAGMITASMRLAFTVHIPSSLFHRGRDLADRWRNTSRPSTSVEAGREDPALLSRARVVADAVALAQRREGAGDNDERLRRVSAVMTGQGSVSATREGRADSFVPLGQSHRRTARRVSATAMQRGRTL
jgi:type IV secretion system protein VirB6